MKSALLALMVAVVTGCGTPTPYEQNIEGVLLMRGVPAANVKVRFLSEYPEDSCEASGVETTTDQTGKFKFRQKYVPAQTERYAVVIHPYRLCIYTDGNWKTVWKEKTGPAPRSIALRCEMNGKGETFCTAGWNGQNYR